MDVALPKSLLSNTGFDPGKLYTADFLRTYLNVNLPVLDESVAKALIDRFHQT
jgi:hypothetical protein